MYVFFFRKPWNDDNIFLVTGQKFWRKYGSIITFNTAEGERPVHCPE
jgi:hypothetical protein